MALPALTALAAAHDLTIHAPSWGPTLYEQLNCAVLERGPMGGDAAVLFAPSLRAAREARGVPKVIGTPTDHRGWWLTDSVEPAAHRSKTYARLVQALGVEAGGPPVYAPRGQAALVPLGHVALNPVCRGGVTRQWTGFFELARVLEHPVVFYGGPGEEHAVARVAGGFPMAVGLSLPDFAATLERCGVFVSNDAGAAHFARAVGVPTIVLHGSTSAEGTGPAGAVAIEGPELPCRPCYSNRCAHDLECLEIGVERVRRSVAALL